MGPTFLLYKTITFFISNDDIFVYYPLIRLMFYILNSKFDESFKNN